MRLSQRGLVSTIGHPPCYFPLMGDLVAIIKMLPILQQGNSGFGGQSAECGADNININIIYRLSSKINQNPPVHISHVYIL